MNPPPGGEEPLPVGSPVPAGQCPHCGLFLYMILRKRPPVVFPHDPKTTALIPETDPRNVPTKKLKERRDSFLD